MSESQHLLFLPLRRPQQPPQILCSCSTLHHHRPACLCCPHRLSITPSGSLVVTDVTNTTQWSTQTSCLPAAAAKGTTNGSVVTRVVNTKAGSGVQYCLDDIGLLTLEDSSTGAVIWSSQPRPGSCQTKRHQLTSHSRSEVQCLLAPLQALLSQDCSMQLAVGTGPLRLSASAPGSPVIWSTQLPGTLPVAAPAGLCLQRNGSLVHSGAGGAVRLWASTAAASSTGPYVALIRDAALQVSLAVCIQVSVYPVACVHRMLGPCACPAAGEPRSAHCVCDGPLPSCESTCCLSSTGGPTWHRWHACSQPCGL